MVNFTLHFSCSQLASLHPSHAVAADRKNDTGSDRADSTDTYTKCLQILPSKSELKVGAGPDIAPSPGKLTHTQTLA